MSGRPVYWEPLAKYMVRRYIEVLLALYLIVVLCVLDVSFIVFSLRESGLLVLNLVLAALVLVLLILATLKSAHRRYSVRDGIVSWPLVGMGLPETSRLEDIVGVAIVPAPPPLGNYPALIIMAVTDHGSDANQSVKRLSIETKSFGFENIKDLVKRLPASKLDPDFGRGWQARIMNEEARFRTGRT